MDEFNNVEMQPSFFPEVGSGVSLDKPVEASFFASPLPSEDTASERSKRYDYALGEKSPGVDQLKTETATGSEDYNSARRQLEERTDLNLRRANLLQAAVAGLPAGSVNAEKIAEIQKMDKQQVDDAYADPKLFYERKFATRVIEAANNDIPVDENSNRPRLRPETYNQILVNQATARKLYEDAMDGVKERTWGEAAQSFIPFYNWIALSSELNTPGAEGSILTSRDIRSNIEAAYRLGPEEFQKTQSNIINRLKARDPELAAKYASALLGYTSAEAFMDNTFNTLDATILTPGTFAAVGVLSYRGLAKLGKLPLDYYSNLKLVQQAGRMNTLIKNMGGADKINYLDLLPLERQAHQIALENIRRKAATVGQEAQWDDLLSKVVQSIHNPQAVLANATNLTAEQAARLEIGMLRTARSALDNLISRPQSLERLSLEELALAQSSAERFVETMYAQTSRASRLVAIKAANVDAGQNLTGVDAVAKYWGASSGKGFATEAGAKGAAKKLNFAEFSTELVNGEWYVKTYHFVDEKDTTLQGFARSGANVKYSDKPNQSFLSPFLSRTRMRDSLIPTQMAEDFKYAQAATNKYFESNRAQFINDFSGLNKESRRDLDSFLERERDYRNQTSNTDVTRGRYAQNVGEFEQRWMKEVGRTPTFEETKAYFSWKSWNDIDYAIRNLDMTKEMVRLGVLDHEFRFRIPGQDGQFYTPKLEGKVLVEFPWDRKGDAGIMIWDVNPQTENVFRKTFVSSKEKEYIDDLIKNKGYRVYHLSPWAKERLADTMASWGGGPESQFIPPSTPLKGGGEGSGTLPPTTTYQFRDVRKAVTDAIKLSNTGAADISDILNSYFPNATKSQIAPAISQLVKEGQIVAKGDKLVFRSTKGEEAGRTFDTIYSIKVDRIRSVLNKSYPNATANREYTLSSILNDENIKNFEMKDTSFVKWMNSQIEKGELTVTNPDTGEAITKMTTKDIRDDAAPDYVLKFKSEHKPAPDYSKFDFTVSNDPKYRVLIGEPIKTSETTSTSFNILKQPEGYTITKVSKVNGKNVQRETLGEDGVWHIVKKGEEKIGPKKYFADKGTALYATRAEQNKFIDTLSISEDLGKTEVGAIEGIGEYNLGDEVYRITEEDKPELTKTGKLKAATATGKITKFFTDPKYGNAVQLDNGSVVPVSELYKPGSKRSNVTFEPNTDILPEAQVTGYQDAKIIIGGKHKANIQYKVEDDVLTVNLISSVEPPKAANSKTGSTLSNTLGPKAIIDIVDYVKQAFPEVTKIKGIRATGARLASSKKDPGRSFTFTGEKAELDLGAPRIKDDIRYGEPPVPPGPPTVGEGPGIYKGWQIKSFDYLIAKPEMDVRSSNLGFVRFPYQEGGHRLYDFDWWIRQPRIHTYTKDKAAIHQYQGDKNAYGAVIESEARDFHTHLENIRTILDNDLENGTNNAEAYYNNYLDGTSGNFKGFKKQFREFDADGHLTTKTPFVVTANNKSAWDYIHSMTDKDGNPVFGNLENFRDSEHNLYHNDVNLKFALERSDGIETVTRKGSTQAPVFGTQMQGTASPMATLINSTSDLIRGRVIDDLKIKSAENFAKNYAAVIDATLELIRRDPMYYILNPQWKQGLTGQDLVLLNSAKDYRRALIDFLGIQDEGREYMITLQRTIGDQIKRRMGQGSYDWVDRHVLRSGAWSPLRWLNNATYDLFFGVFNIKQLIVQAMSSYHSIAVSKYGLDGGFAAWAVRPLLWNETASRTEKMANILVKASRGAWKKEWFVEAASSLKRSGWHIIGAETAMQDDFINQAIKESFIERSREMGRVFFKEGDRIARNTAYMTSYLEWRSANPLAKLTPRIEKEILNRADTLALNMTAASNSMMAKGVAGIPLKFTSYHLRMMEQLIPGWNDVRAVGKALKGDTTEFNRPQGYGPLTPKEKMRAYAMYSLMFGAPVTAGGVFGLWPLHKEWAKMLQERGYDTDENKVLQFFNEGLAGTLPALLGINHNVSTQLGPTGTDWLYDIYNGRSQVFDLLTGVSGAKMYDTIDNAWPFFSFMANVFRTDEEKYPLSWGDLEDFVRSISSVNNTWRSIQMYYTGAYATKTMTPLMQGMKPSDALMTLLMGTQPKEIEKAFLLSDMSRATSKMKDSARRDILRYHRLQMKSIAEGDLEGATLYGKKIRFAIISNGFKPDEMNRLFSDAVTANGDLVRLAEKNFYNSTPDRQKLWMDKIRRKDMENQNGR